jgi:hypothetical protein
MYYRTNQGLAEPQPICEAAIHNLERLATSLKWFNRELTKTYVDPEKLRRRVALVVADADDMSGRVNDFLDRSCCEPELKTLEAQVRALPWTFQRTRGNKVVRVEEFRNIRGAFRNLIEAIQEARRKASSRANCATP